MNLGESAVRMAIKKMNQNQVVKLKNPDVKDIDIRKLNNTGENFLTESGVYNINNGTKHLNLWVYRDVNIANIFQGNEEKNDGIL